MATKKSPVKKADKQKAGKKSTPVRRTAARQKKQSSTEQLLAQREAELQIINAIQVGLASKLEMQEIYEMVGDRIREVFKAQNIIFGIRDRQNNLATFPYAVVNGQRVQQGPFPPDVLGQYLEQTCDPLLIKRSSDWQRFGLEDNGSRSFLAVQLRVGDEFKGAIALSNDEIENAFSESDVRLLSTLVNSMSIALENARLFGETQRLLKETEDRAAELTIINSVQEALASKLDMQAIYDLVGEKIRQIFDVPSVMILSHNRKTNMLEIPFLIQNGSRLTQEPLLLDGTGFSEYVMKTRQPLLIISDYEKHAQEVRSYPLGGSSFPKSAIYAPMMAGGEARGVVYIGNLEKEGAFTDSDLRLMTTLVNSMSIALENARLFDETQRLLKETEQRNAELAIINSVQQGLASKLDMEEIYELVGGKILEIFKADAIGFTVYDSNKNSLQFPFIFDHGERFHPEPVPGARMDDRFSKLTEPLIFHTHQELQNFMKETGVSNLGGQTPDNSHIFLPLRMGTQFIGSISIAKYPENAFSSSDVRLLQTLTASMSVALENARLWEQEKMYRKALQRELEIGREIQAGFLPPSLPLAEGWEIAASLMSAREVAGDFYDAFELPDGNIGIVIADVCDKGVGAALFMTLFRSLVRAASNLEYFEHAEPGNVPDTPADRLRRAIALTNNYIAETHGESGMFATIFFGILDPRSGKLVYINGGHEPPLILASGKVHQVLQKTGPAVGAIADCQFGLQEAQLNHGNILLAFTDGLPDCKNPQEEFFGHERLINFVQGCCDSAQELVKSLELELHNYVASATQFDDITLMAVRRG